MINKKISFILVVLAVFTTVLVYWIFSDYELTKKEKSYAELICPQSQLSLKHFLELNEEGRICRTDIYYAPFDTNDFIPTEKNLVVSFFLATVSKNMHYPNYIRYALKDSIIRKKDLGGSAVQYSCIMYSLSNKAIRFSIGLFDSTTIIINGEPHEASFELIDAFFKLLPARDYELLMKEVQTMKETTEPVNSK